VRREAETAAEDYFATYGESMAVYRCEYCGKFHIGHNPRPPRYRVDWDAVEQSLLRGDPIFIDRMRRARLDQSSERRLTELAGKFLTI